MKTRYILPKVTQDRFDELDERLAEIELQYSEKIKKYPFMEQQIRNGFMNDPAIKALQKAKCDIYEKSVERIEIEFETEEEKEIFLENWKLQHLA